MASEQTIPGDGMKVSSLLLTMDYQKDFLLPVMKMISLAAATILLLLIWLSIKADQRDAEAERTATAVAVKVHIDGMKQYLADCASWDEALQNLVIKVNHNWATLKVGPYLFKSQGYENTFVVNGANWTTYASSGMHEAPIDALRYLGKPLASAMTSIRHMKIGEDRRIAGLTKTADGRVAAFAVAPIVSDTGKVPSPPGGLSFLVLVDLLTTDDVKQIGVSHQLQGLHLTIGDEPSRLALRDPQDEQVGGLSWTPRRPGTALLKSAAPVVAFVLLALFLAARRLLVRARVALNNTQLAADELIASRKMVETREREAREILELTVNTVEAENLRLNTQAEAARRSTLQDAARQFESRIAPILGVIFENATVLTSAAKAGRFRVETVLESMDDAIRSAAHSKQQSETVAPKAAEFQAYAVSIAKDANAGLGLAGLASQHGAEAHASIDGLSDALSSIDLIVEVIETISRQMNLLALNATIEASRAGEAGAGFVVVAGEIKALAHQTEKLTKTVAQKIDGVRDSARVAIHALSGVAAAISRAEQASGAISAAADSQMSASSAIKFGVEAIVDESRSVTSAIEISRAEVADSRRDADQLEGMSSTLSDTIGDLKLAMTSFIDDLQIASAA